MEDGIAILVVDEKLMLVKISGAVGITQFPQAEEIMGEAGHNVSHPCILCWDGWDAKLGCCCGESRFTRRSSYGGAWCSRVDV